MVRESHLRVIFSDFGILCGFPSSASLTKAIFCSLMFPALALGVRTAQAQSSGAILATSDSDCTWKLDGQSQGQLKTDDSKIVHVSSGQHLIQATSADGLATFRTVVDVGSGQVLVSIALKAQHDAKVAAVELDQNPTWTDPATGLMWTRKSHSGRMTLNDYINYCANLNVGGYAGWRLPTIDQLAAIYDQTQKNHVRGDISLGPNEARSGSTFQDPDLGEQVWYFDFRNGTRMSNGTGWGTPDYVLCVRP